jgi:hypothetical protein
VVPAFTPPPAMNTLKPRNVVIAPGALPHRRAAEFAAPEDERVVQHAACLQIADERRGRLVDRHRARLHAFLDCVVVIPRAVVELDHAHAALGEAAREQAVGGEAAVARFLDAVEVEHLGLRLGNPRARARSPAS